MRSPNFKKRTVIVYGLIVGVGISIIMVCIGVFSSSGQEFGGAIATNKTNLISGQWSYLPGATRQKDGLLIKAASLAIVNQDGSGGQPNPPINLYGTRLSNVNDFSLTAGAAQIKGDATIQLYDQPPIIADEFRVERKSARLTFLANSLQVAIWDGSSQSPATVQSFSYSPAATNQLEITYQSGHFTFKVNGKQIGQVAANDLFSDHNIWFGFDSTDSWLLTDLRAQSLNDNQIRIATGISGRKPTSDGLQQLASKKRTGFAIGAAAALGPAVSDPDYNDVTFNGNFGSVTTENALKWQFVHPLPNVYTFQEGDALVALARSRNMAVYGHTLVFGEANPHWVQDLPVASSDDKSKVKQVMVDHIKTVVGHYQGKITTWDVVNEPLADYNNFDIDTQYLLRRHKWYQAMGQGYINEAFNAAHAADPNAKLFINEYGLEEDGDRWNAFLSMITDLKRQGVPIDGVGFQAHVYQAADKISPSVLRKHMQQLTLLGLVSRISEMDVYSEDGTDVQTQQYSDVFQVCLSEPSCVSFTTWGVSNRYDTFKDNDGSIQYGQDLLWTDKMQPTPAVDRIRNILK